MHPSWSPLLAMVHSCHFAVQECDRQLRQSTETSHHLAMAFQSRPWQGCRERQPKKPEMTSGDPHEQDLRTTAPLRAALLQDAHLDGPPC